MSEQAGQSDRLALIQQVLALVYLLLVIWFLMVPAATRARLRMRALAATARLLANVARRAGLASMGHELATGQADYGLPYSLSLARELAARAYHRARGVTP